MTRGQRRVAATPLLEEPPTLVPAMVPLVEAVDPIAIFERLQRHSGRRGRLLAGCPEELPMAILDARAARPGCTLLALALCSSPALAAGLAIGLGFLAGGALAALLRRAKEAAARFTVLRLLIADFLSELPTYLLRRRVHEARRRFGLGEGRGAASEAFEDAALGGIYQEVLASELEGPEGEAEDLRRLKRLREALDLDGVVVGQCHARAANSLMAKREILEGEALRVATDKLLFLSQRAFADEEVEEAELFEMARVRQILEVPVREAKERVRALSRALYQQSLSAVMSEDDGRPRERQGAALADASADVGLHSEEAAQINAGTYREIVREQLESGRLAPKARGALEHARSVLRLSARHAASVFLSVAAPMLLKDLAKVSSEMQAEERPNTAELEKAAKGLKERAEDLGLAPKSATAVIWQGFSAALQGLCNRACTEASQEAIVASIDGLLLYSENAGKVLAEIDDAKAPRFTMTLEPVAARRLFKLYYEKCLSGQAARSPGELARLLELPHAEQDAIRIEVCQPRLMEVYEDCLQKAKPDTLPLLQAAVNAKIVKLKLPPHIVEAIAMAVYKARLDVLSPKGALDAQQKTDLDGVRNFLQLQDKQVELLHLSAFGKTYEANVKAAMGESGVMSTAVRTALGDVRKRLGLGEEDARKILNGVIESRMLTMVGGVLKAWLEASRSKPEFAKLRKSDPSIDGTGGDLGIKDGLALEDIKGARMMEELLKVRDFYVANEVVEETKDGPEYPVTLGAQIEEKVREEMYGHFAWNAITCRDAPSREEWQAARPHVGGILGLSSEDKQRILVRMVSRWCNNFIHQRLRENGGQLERDDINTIMNWVPQFFGVEKELAESLLMAANRSLLEARALRLLNQPCITPADLEELRADVRAWGLNTATDLGLTRPQSRSLFRVEVTAALEDPFLSNEHKLLKLEQSRSSFGLEKEEAAKELADLLRMRGKGRLSNAVGDLLQGNEEQAMQQMRVLGLLVSFTDFNGAMELVRDWDVDPLMVHRLLDLYESSPAGDQPASADLLKSALGLAPVLS